MDSLTIEQLRDIVLREFDNETQAMNGIQNWYFYRGAAKTFMELTRAELLDIAEDIDRGDQDEY